MTEPALEDPAFLAGDPDGAFAELRRAGSVRWHEPGAFWAVTGHADVLAVSKDPEVFCSGRGVLLADRSRQINPAESVLYLDPPAHGLYRRLVSRAFTPRRVATLEPRVRAVTRELLDALEPHAPVDLVETVTAPLPLMVIAELLGVPRSDLRDFRRWSDAVAEAATNLTEANAAVATELLVYFDAQLDARAEAPADDLLGALVAAQVDGEHLTRPEQLGFCMTLLVAGNETTRALLSGGVLTLAEHPDQRAALAADPAAIPAAVEEMLRWVTPIQAFARTAACPAELSGQRIEPADYVVMYYGAANRDEEAFGADARRFDAARSPNAHVAFGIGEHFCLGAGLARLEARVFFEELLARWPRHRLTGPVRHLPSTLLRQVESLPVLLDPPAVGA